MRVSTSLTLSLLLAAPLAWGQSIDRTETASLLTWINEARAAEGVAPLAADARLSAVAEAHSLDMASHRFFSHSSPSTGAPADRASAAGVGFRSLAENIAMNQSVREAHVALLRSPGHRANLLNGELRRVGLGVVRASDGVYVTQLFVTMRDEAEPATAPAPSAPEAPSATPAGGSDALSGLPRVINALPGLLGLSGWAPGRAPAQPPPARANRRRPSSAWSVPTPFGAMRVELPRELRGAWDAPADELRSDPDEAVDDAPAPSCRARR